MVTKAGVGGRGAGGWGERSGYKRTTQGIFVVMEMLCVLVSTPPVTLHYGPATHHPRAEEKKGMKDPLSYVLTTVGDSSDLKIEGLMRQDSSQQSG